MTAEEIKIVVCVFVTIFIFYWKIFGGKPNER